MSEKRAFKKPSIKDVARRAEVSVTTVSHVVSQTPGYSAETIRRVKAAIEELNYVPSYAANALRQRSTRTIGVCATDPFERSGRDVGSFPDRLWAGILEEADTNHYKVIHFPRSIRESAEAGEFLNGQIDGLIIAANPYDRRPAQVARAGLPVVMVARTFDIPDGVNSVSVDEASIVGAGLSHLYELGHRKIAYVAGPAYEVVPTDSQPLSYDDVAKARLLGYCAWMKERVPEFQPVWTVTPEWDEFDLTSIVRQWMDKVAPTAIFASCDRHARCVLKAAESLGLRVPEDLSVLGIDNDQECALSNPSLSSIDVPIQQVGQLAVRRLIECLGGAPAKSTVLNVSAPEVAARASTGPCPNP